MNMIELRVRIVLIICLKKGIARVVGTIEDGQQNPLSRIGGLVSRTTGAGRTPGVRSLVSLPQLHLPWSRERKASEFGIRLLRDRYNRIASLRRWSKGVLLHRAFV